MGRLPDTSREPVGRRVRTGKGKFCAREDGAVTRREPVNGTPFDRQAPFRSMRHNYIDLQACYHLYIAPRERLHAGQPGRKGKVNVQNIDCRRQ